MKKKHPDSKLTINKVKLSSYDESLESDNQMTGLEIGYTEELLGEENALEFVKEYPNVKLRNFLTHDDLIQRFEALRPHMAMLCEYHSDGDVEEDYFEQDQMMLFDPRLFFKAVFVTQVTLTGHDENSGVVLTGFRLLRDGSKLNLVTPNLKFEYAEYRFIRELSDAVDELTAEAMLALTERKRKIVQAELFDDEQATDDEFNGETDFMKDIRSGAVKVTIGQAG